MNLSNVVVVIVVMWDKQCGLSEGLFGRVCRDDDDDDDDNDDDCH